MLIHGVAVEDTFAEAFGMKACRLIITAISEKWALVAAQAATGHASSVIGCDCEAGIERVVDPSETPDGRPGVACLFFSFDRDSLQRAVVSRVGQSVMTTATSACYDGTVGAERSFPLGATLRFFGDGYQASKQIADHRYWRIPVMDGEFLCQDVIGVVDGIGGGNLLLLGRDVPSTLQAAVDAVEAIEPLADVICPFPAGIVRSGSKVGSRYAKLRASTNHAYCPTLKGRVATALPADVNAVYEIVVDGLSQTAIKRALAVGLRAACRTGIVSVSAGNYGGSLGKYHFRLHALFDDGSPG